MNPSKAWSIVRDALENQCEVRAISAVESVELGLLTEEMSEDDLRSAAVNGSGSFELNSFLDKICS